jgi:hypothetical protein
LDHERKPNCVRGGGKDNQKRVAGCFDLFALRKLSQRLTDQGVVLSEEIGCGAVAPTMSVKSSVTRPVWYLRRNASTVA